MPYGDCAVDDEDTHWKAYIALCISFADSLGEIADRHHCRLIFGRKNFISVQFFELRMCS